MSGSENPFEDKGEPNPFEDPSVQATGGSGGDGFDANPYEQPAASAPPEQAASASASPAKPSGGAYDAAPAPSSTYGAYDTGAYAASSTNAYASSPTPAYNVRLPRPNDSSVATRERPDEDAQLADARAERSRSRDHLRVHAERRVRPSLSFLLPPTPPRTDPPSPRFDPPPLTAPLPPPYTTHPVMTTGPLRF